MAKKRNRKRNRKKKTNNANNNGGEKATSNAGDAAPKHEISLTSSSALDNRLQLENQTKAKAEAAKQVWTARRPLAAGPQPQRHALLCSLPHRVAVS